MEPGTDAEAIAASLDDPGRFGVVFDRHAAVVFRYLTRRIGPGDADALLGDVFRIAFEKRATFDTERPNARPWLYGIATKLVARHRRSEARRLRATARFAARASAGADLADDVATSVDAVERAHAVADAIGRLPDGERDALALYAWEDLGYDEIAVAMGVPVGTVRSRLHRARNRLRELDAAGGEQLTTAVRRRPQAVGADDPGQPRVFAREKERLMAMIGDGKPGDVRFGASRMYPRLAYRDEVAALDYLVRVFQFRERREARMGTGEGDDGMLAWLEFGDGVVMIGRANHDIHRIHSPAEVGHATTMINVDLHDIDAHYAHAVAEGADITMPIEDAFYGSRRYEATDLEGHRWHFSEPLADIRARGGEVADGAV